MAISEKMVRMRGTNDELGDTDGMTDDNETHRDRTDDEIHHDGTGYDGADYDGTDHDGTDHDRTDRDEVEILGTTLVAQGGRISIVEGVREAFADRGIEIQEGDRLVYKLRDGHVVVELA